MNDVSVSDDLKKVLAECKPGESKTISVTVAMDKSGKVTLKANGDYPSEEKAEKAEKTEEKPKAKAKSSRPRPVMDAIAAMY